MHPAVRRGGERRAGADATTWTTRETRSSGAQEDRARGDQGIIHYGCYDSVSVSPFMLRLLLKCSCHSRIVNLNHDPSTDPIGQRINWACKLQCSHVHPSSLPIPDHGLCEYT